MSVLHIFDLALVGGIVVIVAIVNLILAPSRMTQAAQVTADSEANALKEQLRVVLKEKATLEKERTLAISVTEQTGHSAFGVGPHLMWAALEISNSNPRQALTNVQARVVNCEHVAQAQRWVEVPEQPDRQRGEDIPNTFRVMGQLLADWVPIHLLWGPTQLVATTIPPRVSRTVIVAFSDNSNGPPGVFNDRDRTLLHLENRVTIEVSSPEMTAWHGYFFIHCEGNIWSNELGPTPSHFEFEPWETWASTRTVIEPSASALESGTADSQNQGAS